MPNSVFLESRRTDDSKLMSKNRGADRLNGDDEQNIRKGGLDFVLSDLGAGTSTVHSGDLTGKATAAACFQKFTALENAHIIDAAAMTAFGDIRYLGRRH